jgi:hypothetical protein
MLKSRLFRFILIIVTALTTFLCVASCSPESTPRDQCGTVTGWDINYNGDYVVYIDGDSHVVIASTWYDAEVGMYMCIEY